MPVSKIETAKQWNPADRQYLMDSVHAALVDAFAIPEHDKLIRYIEHAPGLFAIPTDRSENFILLEIAVFPGRSLQAKRRLYRGIVERFGKLGIDPLDIRILLHEVPLDNWGIRGGIPASEVSLEYKLNV